MSYLPSFEYDVFISYTHTDNEIVTGERGWIDAFHHVLERRLPIALGVEAKVWRDPKVRRNEHINDSLPRRVREAAVLISVLSPLYLNSEWCLKEVKVFRDNAEASGGLKIGDRSRIMKVFKYPVDNRELIPSLGDVMGHDLYRVDEKGIPHELDPDIDKKARLEFVTKLTEIAYEVRELLNEFKEPAGKAAIERPEPRTVYLAETTWDIREERELVRRELRQRGFRVFPDGPLVHTPEFRDQVREQLRQSEVSIHLVGSHYGIVPERETSSVVPIQYALARERIGQGRFTRIVWIPEEVRPEEERQVELIRALRTDPEAHAGGTELLEGKGVEDLKTTILDVLERTPTESVPQVAGAEVGTVPFVYVICDPTDEEPGLALRDYLLAQEVEAVLPLWDGTETEVRADHQENLIACDAALIYWGQASEAWLRAQLRELLKAPGYGRESPIAVQGIYIGAPSADAKRRFATRQALVMREAASFSLDLRPFLDQLLSAS